MTEGTLVNAGASESIFLPLPVIAVAPGEVISRVVATISCPEPNAQAGFEVPLVPVAPDRRCRVVLFRVSSSVIAP